MGGWAGGCLCVCVRVLVYVRAVAVAHPIYAHPRAHSNAYSLTHSLTLTHSTIHTHTPTDANKQLPIRRLVGEYSEALEELRGRKTSGEEREGGEGRGVGGEVNPLLDL